MKLMKCGLLLDSRTEMLYTDKKGGDCMKRIGVVIPAITEDLQSELLDSIYRTAAAAGCDVIVLTTATTGLEYHVQSDMMTGEENVFSLIGNIRLDGILFASQYYDKESVLTMITERIRAAALPCVDLGDSIPCFESVSIPQEEALYTLTNHVIEQHQCRRLLFLGGPEGHPDSEQRLRGFLRAVQEHSCSHEIVYGDFWRERAAILGTELIHKKRIMPDAVLCASDMMAVALCETLKAGGISIPEDIIVTGYDGHISALSNFPSITTVGGGISSLGTRGTVRLLELMGMDAGTHENSEMHILYGASCGCAERITDYQSAAAKVQEHIRQEAEANELLEMRINSDIITRAATVGSFAELMQIFDRNAHIIKGFRSLHLCLCHDWEGDLNAPDSYRTAGYPGQMLCVLSKIYGMDGEDKGRFPTAHIIPMLSQPHEPVMLFLLPLHASVQVFGYCAFVYDNPKAFRITVMLVNMMSAVATGLLILRRKRYSDYLRKKIEEASLYDKMTDMLSKKGLLLYLEKQMQLSARTGIMLVTIEKMISTANAQNHAQLSDKEIQTELLLANALRLLSGHEIQTARLDKKTFAAAFPLPEKETPEQRAEEMMIQLDVLIRKMQEGTAAAFLPEPYYVCGICEAPAETYLSGLWESLRSSRPKESGFIGIHELKKLRREIHRAPELNWNLSELARRLNISKSYVQRLYQEHFGISYLDDLIAARIRMAQELLTATDLRISEISEACGYSNDTHFMRQFKAKTGITPSAYRKMK